MKYLRDQVTINQLKETELYKVSIPWETDTRTFTVILDGTHPSSGRRVHIVKGFLPPSIICNALVVGSHEVAKLIGFENLKVCENIHD